MTVRQLKAYLEGIGEEYNEALVVRECDDHAYRELSPHLDEAERAANGRLFEFYGPEHMALRSSRVWVVVLS